MRRSSSSVESGPTPSKNTPTSNFHFFRYARRSGGFSSSVSSTARERLCAASDAQPPLTAGAQVLDPLRVPARRDEILRALVAQEIDRRLPPLTRCASLDLEHAGSVDAHAEAGQSSDDPVEHVGRKPAGALVVLVHGPDYSRLAARRGGRRRAQRLGSSDPRNGTLWRPAPGPAGALRRSRGRGCPGRSATESSAAGRRPGVRSRRRPWRRSAAALSIRRW